MDLIDVLLLGGRGSGSSCTFLLGFLHILVMITSHVSGFLADKTCTLLHQGDSLLGGHCIYVHCVIVLLLIAILLCLEVVQVVHLLRFLESSSSSVRLFAHTPEDVHGHAVLTVNSDRFLNPSVDCGWWAVK